MKQNAMDAALEALRIEAAAVARMEEWLDKEALAAAADVLVRADKVITSGCGGSGVAMEKFTHSLCCIEKPALFLSPAKAVHGGLGCVTARDAVVVLSRGGKTAELIPIVNVAKKKGAAVIAMVENRDSVLARAADVVLPFVVDRESDPLNIMTTTSFVIPSVICNALLAAVMVETGYVLEQFALIHPGGAVGEFLNSK